MAEVSGEPRFFIQIDPGHQHANIARWVQFNLTNEFVFRVRDLHRLLDLNRLELVTTGFEANWCLADGWVVSDSLGVRNASLEVWSYGFTVKSHVVRASESKNPRAQSLCVEASSGWGSIDEFFNEFYQKYALDAYDFLDTAEGLYDSIPGEPPWDVVFAKQVIAHLAASGQEPLEVHDGLQSRLADENLRN
jgi:hypothetical protein